MFKKLKALFAVGLALLLLVSTFGIQGEAATPRKGFDPKKVGGNVTYSSISDAAKLTPNTVSDAPSNRIMGFVFDTLLDADKSNKIVPSIASSWKIENNNQKFTFSIRKDIKWHDGKPLTAEDVKFSFDMYMHKDSVNVYKGNFDMIKTVTVKDKYTVVFDLKEPAPLFLYSVGTYIIPKHKFPKGVSDYNNSNFSRNPVGSGPFKFKEWKTAQRIVVVANKDYWRGRPYLDQITMKVVPDANVEVVNLLKKQVDFVETIAPNLVSQVSKDKGVQVVKHDQARYDYIGLLTTDPRFSDERVRKALQYGLNRKAIVDSVMLKNATLGTGPFHPSEANYNKNVKAYEYSTKKAVDLLDDAGWKMGSDGYRHKDGKTLEFEISYNNGNKTRESIAKIAQADWKKIGVKATPRSIDFTIQSARIKEGKIECWIGAWLLGNDPDKYGLWHSSQIPTTGNNNQRIKDPKVDKLMDDFRSEANPTKRAEIYQEVHKILNDNAYSLWLYYPKVFTAHNKDLAGIDISIYSNFYSALDWYWKNPAKRK